MSARSFRSVGWVAGVAATALGCYMVNLKVASERAALEEVETRIVLAERDIRVLQTEIGTRGRLAQLEKWNVKVLALSAPEAGQFLNGSFQLATLVAPKKVIDPAAPVVLASAPAPAPKPVLTDDGAVAAPVAAGPSPAQLMHTASLKQDVAPKPAARPPVPTPVKPKKTVEKTPAARTTVPDKPAKLAKEQKDSPPTAAKGKAANPKVASANAVPVKAAPAKPKATAKSSSSPRSKEVKAIR